MAASNADWYLYFLVIYTNFIGNCTDTFITLFPISEGKQQVRNIIQSAYNNFGYLYFCSRDDGSDTIYAASIGTRTNGK